MARRNGAAAMSHRVALIAALILVATLAVKPAFAAEPIDRFGLTGKLVPVTGETTRSLDLTVPFVRDSAKLMKVARIQLDELAAALSGDKLRGFRVEVYGHTDASGSATYNLNLSRARAAETVRYLVEKRGLDRRRFRHEGYGENRLLTGLDPRSPRHRRVEVVVVNDSFVFPKSVETRSEEDVKRGDESGGKTQGEGGGLRAVQ